MLVLIPATVNGEALTLNKLQDLIKNPRNEAPATDYENYSEWTKNEHGSTKVERSHWVLMTRDIVPGSRNKTYEQQKKLVNQYSGYVLPGALEVVVCISMEHVSSGSKLFGEEPFLYTRCAEILQNKQPVIVGGFGSRGFDVWYYDGFDIGSDGVAALRKF